MREADFYVDKRLHAPKAFYDWCYSQIPTIIFSNKNKVISSSRKGCEVIRKRLTKKQNWIFMIAINVFQSYCVHQNV